MHSALKRDAQAQPSWATGPAAYGVNAYDKGALTLRTLENYLGWTTFQNVMSTYFGEYAFRHPTPEDFFSVAERVSGVDLTWFFEQAYGDSVVFDYAVGEVDSSPVRGVRGWVEPDPGEAGPQLRTAGARGDEHTSVVHVRRWGEGVFPVTVEIRFTDGERLVEQWDGKDRWKRYAYTRAGKVDEVRIDPDHQLVLDIDSTNNSWMRRSQADVAATKWASKWVVWVQATLEAFAFFS
jgi:hypothetical protein